VSSKSETTTTNSYPEVNVLKVEAVADMSAQSANRSREVSDLISQMISIANKRGRPVEKESQVADAA